MENLLRNTDRSPGGTCWNSSHCGRMPSAPANGAQVTAHPRRTPARPHANPVDTEIHSAASERGGIDSKCGDQMGHASDCRLPAEGRQTSGFVASSGQLFSESETEIRHVVRKPDKEEMKTPRDTARSE